MVPVLKIANDISLPDTDQWQFRFEVESETSNRVYIIAQNKKRKHWGCSCPGWKRNRQCKHLQALNIPGKEQPYEVNVIKD